MIDNEIIKKARDKDHDAINIVIKEHEKLIYSIVNSFSIDSSDYDLSKEDMFQEGLIGLMKAVNTYDFSKGVKFSTYAYHVIHRKVTKEFKRQFEIYFEESFSYSKFEEFDRHKNLSCNCIMEDPVFYYERKNTNDYLMDLIEDLDEEDKTIMNLRLMSYTYEEIANMLNTTSKKVDYRLRKIKKEIREKRKLLNA